MFIVSCRFCSVEFEAKSGRRMYCSRSCKDKGKPSASGLACFICEKPMVRGRTSMPQGQAAHNECRTVTLDAVPHGTVSRYDYGCRCIDCATARAAKARAYTVEVRAKHGVSPSVIWRSRFRAASGYSYGRHSSVPMANRRAIYERDAWVCQICTEPISDAVDTPFILRASVDHIVPQSSGFEPDHSTGNLRMAHVICNSLRGDNRMTDEQVRILNPTVNCVREMEVAHVREEAASPC